MENPSQRVILDPRGLGIRRSCSAGRPAKEAGAHVASRAEPDELDDHLRAEEDREDPVRDLEELGELRRRRVGLHAQADRVQHLRRAAGDLGSAWPGHPQIVFSWAAGQGSGGARSLAG